MRLNDPYDPQQNAYMASLILKENQDSFRHSYGRDPTGAELFGTHLLGTGDFNRIFSNLDRPAADMVSKIVSRNNPNYFYNEQNQPYTGREFQGQLAKKFNASPSKVLGDPNRPINLPIADMNSYGSSSYGYGSSSHGDTSYYSPQITSSYKPSILNSDNELDNYIQAQSMARTPAAAASYSSVPDRTYNYSSVPDRAYNKDTSIGPYREGSAQELFSKGNSTYSNQW